MAWQAALIGPATDGTWWILPVATDMPSKRAAWLKAAMVLMGHEETEPPLLLQAPADAEGPGLFVGPDRTWKALLEALEAEGATHPMTR
jgi:hypothetical protein